MRKTILPKDFQDKLNILCIIAKKFNVKIKDLKFSSIGSWEVECFKGENYYTDLAVINISFSNNNVEGYFRERKDSSSRIDFSFIRLFDSDSFYSFILNDKIDAYYFKDGSGEYQCISDYSKINITYSDSDGTKSISSKEKRL